MLRARATVRLSADTKQTPLLSTSSIVEPRSEQKRLNNSSAQPERDVKKVKTERKQESELETFPGPTSAIVFDFIKKNKHIGVFPAGETVKRAKIVLQEEYEAKLQGARDEFELRAREYEARLEAEKTAHKALQADMQRSEEDWQKRKDEFEVSQKEMQVQVERRVKAVEEKLAAEERRHAVSRSEIEIVKEEKAILITEKELSERKARLTALRAQHDATEN
ncbi:hypothetical protein CPB85DRAFT_1431442 [Mucidula mucida]|nr:hypothetical protein CPB85DRAFT_1431442 [Mucidula mucida]